MPRPFALPDLGEGLTEAEIVKVLVNEGDVIVEDAPLLEVETDKATVEIPSPFGGRVARIHVHPGQSVKVGDVLVTFDDGGAPSGLGGASAPVAATARSAAAPASRAASAAASVAATGKSTAPAKPAGAGGPAPGAHAETPPAGRA